MSINNFRIGFKEYIQKKFTEELSNYNIHIATDISYYLDGTIKFTENDIVVIITNGNFTRSSADQMHFFNGAISINIYCSALYKEDVFEKITSLIDTMSEVGYIGYFGNYQAAFNFNTPASDSVQRIFSGIHVGFIGLYGTVTYFNNSIDSILKIPNVYFVEYIGAIGEGIKNKIKLNNIFSYSSSSSHQSCDFNAMGSRFMQRYEDLDNVTYSLSLIVDLNNNLHNELLRISNKYKSGNVYYSNNKIVEIMESESITTGEFRTFLQVSTTYNIGNFSAINLVIMR